MGKAGPRHKDRIRKTQRGLYAGFMRPGPSNSRSLIGQTPNLTLQIQACEAMADILFLVGGLASFAVLALYAAALKRI